jgi:uncharacterized RDD family membrane protein YckC
MVSGLLDASPSHWIQIFCAFPLFFIDGLSVIAAPAVLVYFNVVDAFPSQTETLANSFFVSIMVANWLYFSLFESSAARGTPGKIFMELAVVDRDGKSVDFLTASIRHLSKLCAAIALYLPYFGQKRNRCLHDLISNSFVETET